jgi:hypothetical protein
MNEALNAPTVVVAIRTKPKIVAVKYFAIARLPFDDPKIGESRWDFCDRDHQKAGTLATGMT